jgi:hypothetical protein
MKKETGLDLRHDALGLFTGPATVSVYLSDLEALIGQIRGSNKSIREVLGSVGVALTAEVREPAKMAALLEQSRASLMSTRRMPLRTREVVVGDQSVTLFEPDRKAPTLGWGIAGSHYFYGAGVGRAERTARYLLGEPVQGEGMAEVLASGPAAELAKEPGASVMVIRTAEVVGGLKSVLAKLSGQAEKFGAGKVVASVIELVGTFGDIALSVQPAADGLEFSIREHLQ